MISIHEAGNGFARQIVTFSNTSTKDRLGGEPECRARDREVLVDSSIGSFWLKNGTGALTPTGIRPTSGTVAMMVKAVSSPCTAPAAPATSRSSALMAAVCQVVRLFLIAACLPTAVSSWRQGPT
ncbi:MAG: hypothetical protein IPG64_08775 [Haliea sp.]|nr:hypothetical protein [Haliea sp.]